MRYRTLKEPIPSCNFTSQKELTRHELYCINVYSSRSDSIWYSEYEEKIRKYSRLQLASASNCMKDWFCVPYYCTGDHRHAEQEENEGGQAAPRTSSPDLRRQYQQPVRRMRSYMVCHQTYSLVPWDYSFMKIEVYVHSSLWDKHMLLKQRILQCVYTA